MALAKLDKSKNPKIVVVTNSSLNYIDKNNELRQREAKTAALNVITEAANVSKMDLGTLQVSFKKGGNWENYWINVDDRNNISLKPTNSMNKDDIIYVNAFINNNGKYSYSINTNSEAGKAFVDGLSVKTYVNEQEARTASYVESRVTLKNDKLKEKLSEKGESAIAILSKGGIEITTESELKVDKATKTQEQKNIVKENADIER